MKRLTTFIVACFCTVGVLLWAAQSFVTTWEPQIRARLEKGIGDALHAQVQIDGVSLAFIHRIHLANVQVWDLEKPRHLIFRASDIALTISFIDLPRALADRNPIESIGLVSLESPWILLSPEMLHQRLSGGRSKKSPPLFFTLVWDHGTFQVQDPQAPHGRWTLYQAHGDFKIRGPHLAHMEWSIRGVLEQADLARIEFSSYGHRWSAQGLIRGGDIPGVLSVAEKLFHRPLIPADWKTKGHFSLDVQLGGRHGLVPGDSPWTYLEEGKLALDHAEIDVGHGLPALELTGSLRQEGLRTSARDLTLTANHQSVLLTGNAWLFGKEPRVDLRILSRDLEFGLLGDYFGKPGWLQGKGSLEMTALGPLSDSSRIAVNAKIPQGQIGRWPFEDADLHLQKARGRWEFADSAVRFLDGRISVKGGVGVKDGNVQVTGENLSLANAGRLNFSCAVRGSSGTFTTTGSFWDSHFSWGNSPPEAIQGDFEIGPHHFEGQAVSEHSSYRMNLEGERTSGEISLEQWQIHLPGGTSLAVEGTLEQPGQALDATVDIHALKIPADAPFLTDWIPQVRGSVDIHGQIAGTLQEPALKGMLTSDTLQIGSESVPRATAVFDMDRSHMSVSKFSLGQAIQGQWTQTLPFPGSWRLQIALDKARADWISSLLLRSPLVSGELSGRMFLSRPKDQKDPLGDGMIEIEQGSLKKYPFSHADANFTLRPGEFVLKTLEVHSPSAHAHLQAKALWAAPLTDQKLPVIHVEGNGRLQDTNTKNPWETPLEFKGDLLPASHWKGELELAARGIQIRQENTEALSGRFAWDSDSIAWSNLRWGTQWTSHGRYSFQKDSPGWSARLEAKEAALGTLRRLFYPASREPVDGLLSGLFTVESLPDNPTARFSGNIQKGLWRAFHFAGDFQGQWDKNGLEPLAVTATSVEGGTLTFHGSLRRSPAAGNAGWGNVQGTLQISNFNLRPLGESLKFPKPLQGMSQGTFTVNGPMDQIALTGHVDGGPLSYGDQKPFQLEHFTLDVTLATPRDAPDRMRLTVSEGSAKTTEEQIRLTPGSFVEFAGDKQARLQVGTEIRNLHLGVFTLFGGLDLNGSWQIKPEGFAIQGDAHTRSLFINDYELEEGHVWADYYNGLLHFTAPPHAPALITGTLDFHHAPQLKFTDFFISGKDQQGLQLNGDIGPALWDFTLNGHGLDIGTLGSLAGFSYPLEGNADVSVKGTGDLGHPHVEGTIQLQDGRALGLAFHSGSAAFVWQDYRMTFTHLQLQDPGRYTLTGAGVFPLAATRPSSPSSSSPSSSSPSSSSPSSSSPSSSSPSSSPPNAVVGGLSTSLTADGSPTTTSGMTSGGTSGMTAEAKGMTSGGAGDQGIDFSVRLQDSNLGLLQSLSKEVRQARGSVDGLLQITGSAGQPVLHGSLKVANGDVVGAHYFKHLTHFNMAADFEGDKLVIHELKGQSGNGEFQIAGDIAFAGFEPSAYNLRADVTSARGLDVQVPELAIPDSPLAKKFRFLTTASHSDVKGHVAFTGPAESPTFKGDGSFSNGHFSFPPSQKNPPPQALLDWFRRINWDVDLHFADGAWFENELVEANLTGTLHLKGPSDRLRVDGGMDINEGKISYLSVEFDIEQARFDLRSQEDDHGVTNTEYVRGIAQSNVQAVDTVNGASGGAGANPSNQLEINDTITLTIDYAPIDEIKPRLTSASDPNLSQDKLLARVTQLDTDNLTPQERNTLYQQQMVRLIDTGFATPLANNLLKRTGLVDTFKVSHFTDPSQAPTSDATSGTAQQQPGAAGLLANTKYTFQKNLSSRLSLGYGVRFEQITEPDLITTKLDLVNDVELSYRWFRNVYVRGSFDLPTSDPSITPDRKVTIEPRWRFGWWGNTNKPKPPQPDAAPPAPPGAPVSP